MKRNLFRLLSLFITFLIVSCAKDDPFEEDASFETTDLSATIGRSTTPCVKSLASMVSGSTVDIGCVSDLSGKTVNLPKGADIKYDGGTILNGTLHFDGGTIDGRLLNKDLKITGTVKLANNNYTFEPDQWGITQGLTTNKNALANRVNLEEAIQQVKSLGGDTFKINSLDAYFDVTTVTKSYKNVFWENKEAINIPSNFHVQLSSNTNIYVKSNNSYKYALFCMDQTTNSKLSGGNLYGDREYHRFNGNPRFPTHEWGTLVLIHGAQHAKVENVKMSKANGDNLKIESFGYIFNNDYEPSRHVTVTGCSMDLARRNGLTITGGEDILIEGNSFSRTGFDIGKSKGTNPRFSIDIEAYRKKINGKFIPYEHVDGVVVKNNTQKNSARGGFLNSVGSNVIFEDNVVENGISYKHGINTIIRNNHIKAGNSGGGTGIGAGDYYEQNTQKNNKIYGNTIEGFDVGIQLRRQDHQVYDNDIINCQMGIQAQFLSDTKIYDNTFKSDVYKSKGINFFYTWCDNVEISGNTFNTSRNSIYLKNVNNGSSNKNKKLTIKNNTIKNKYQLTLINSNNIYFDNNKIYTNLELFDCENINLNRNTIDAHTRNTHTIDFRGSVKDISISYNKLIAPKGKWNTKVDNRVKMKELHEWGNSMTYK